jgi:hypothetical protein
MVFEWNYLIQWRCKFHLSYPGGSSPPQYVRNDHTAEVDAPEVPFATIFQ